MRIVFCAYDEKMVRAEPNRPEAVHAVPRRHLERVREISDERPLGSHPADGYEKRSGLPVKSQKPISR